MDLGIAGRVAIVTAASKGLGLASALALAQEGAKLAICARTVGPLREAEAELGQITEVLAVASDITEPAAPGELVAATVERFGRLDIVVANAGGPPAGRSLAVDDAAFQAGLNANLLTSVRLVRESVPHMRANGWGRICLITSTSIKQPIPTLSLSNSSRVALWAWAKTAAADLYPDGITLNTACPGLHATDRILQLHLQDTGPIGDPARFGQVVAFLCSEPSSFVSGAAVSVDGAASLSLF